jgi:superfamily II DNA or RNA helicase
MEEITLILSRKDFVIKNASIKTIRSLESITSYKVAGYYFSQAYKAHRWDGREHLLKFKRGQYVAPIGLLSVVKAKLRERGEKFVVKLRKEKEVKRIQFDWNDSIKLRGYQNEAVEAFCGKPEIGRGILKMPIRSGKTKTAAAIIRRLGVRTLFFVPSKMLLHQTVEALLEALPGASIGMIGDNEWIEGDVTVATIQSVSRLKGGSKRQCKGNKQRDESGRSIKGLYGDRVAACGRKKCDGAHGFNTRDDPRYFDLLERYPFVIFDECFVAGTMVGDKPIENIKVGDYVPSFDPETLEICEKRVTHVFKSSPSSLVKVATSHGEVICTPNHPILTNRGFISAIDLIPLVDIVYNTMQPKSKKERCEKNLCFEAVRVESVEILKQGSDGEYNGLCPKGLVYNLEVEDTHTYIANGLAVHNCHHAKGENWRGPMLDSQAKYRLGLSATVFFDNESELEKGVIWLRACCGDIKYEVSTSLLVDQGYLMRQHVEIYRIKEPVIPDEKWNKELQNKLIYNNLHRNKIIVLLTMRQLEKGHNVLIISNRLSQIDEISNLLFKYGVEHATITGSDPTDARNLRMNDFKSGVFNVLVGTVFHEGIDIPEVECVINAEGGKDVKTTIQRMRNMTPSEGKTKSILIDFWDDTSKYFRRHSNARLKTYESEHAFVIDKEKSWLK